MQNFSSSAVDPLRRPAPANPPRPAEGPRVAEPARGAVARLPVAPDAARRAEAAEADAIRLRALLIRRETEIAWLRDPIDRLHAETPGLRTRLQLVRENRSLSEQLVALRRRLGGGARLGVPREQPAFGA